MAKGETYEQFVEKFRPKRTTDDCYTPPLVYEAVKGWACREYGIDPARVVRPFWPGGDYERFEYPEGCAVIDNPPFSILSAICAFYIDRDVPFLLFAPSLTCLGGASVCMRMNHLITDCAVVYENGAEVSTSFVTNMGGGEYVMQSAPRYEYPYEVATAAMLQRYAKYGVEFGVRRDECVRIAALDMQRDQGKAIFGGGLLLGERAAAERAAAERWTLSARERAVVAGLRG